MGIISAIWVIIEKLVQQHYGEVFRPVTEQPLFFIAILAMIIGSQFFLAGYVGELIARSSGERNKYQIERKIL